MKQKSILTISLLALTLLFGSCHRQEAQHEKPLVAVSILPLKYLVDNLSGGAIEALVMLPPGTGHEAYDPSPRQMAELTQARIYFTTGHTAFDETWLPNLAEHNPQMKVSVLTDGIELIEGACNHDQQHAGGHHHGVDPHFWLSPRAFSQMAATMLQELTTLLPDQQANFRHRYDSLARVFAEIDSLATHQLGELKSRRFMVFHPALTYFARDYGLEQIAIEAGGKTPGAAGLKSFVDIARSEKLRVIFIQKEYDSTNASAIAREIGATTRSFDHMAYNWPESMRGIIAAMKESLQQ